MTITRISARFLASAILFFGMIASAFSQTTSVVKTFNTPGLSGIVFGAGVTTANVSMWGGGGGGSAGGMKEYVNATDYILHYGSGGGGSNWAGNSFSVIPGAFYPFTVGTGGAAGGFDDNGEPMSGGNGTDSYFLNGTVIAHGGSGGTIVGFHAYGGARAINSFPDPGPPYAADGASEYPNSTTGGNGGLSNSGPYGPSGVNVSGWSGLGWPQVQGTPSGGPGTRPGDGGGGGGMTVWAWPLVGVLSERKPGGSGANGVVSFYVTYPTYRFTSDPVATKLCGPGTSIITLRSTTLFPGNYTVTYSTTNPVTTGNTVGMVWNAAGYGTFSTIPLSGTSTITITNLASGNTCSDAITQFNTVTAIVENTTANSWNPQLDFGGNGRSNAVAFSMGNKAYVGTGKNGTTLLNDFWQFDQATNTWTQLANFAGGNRTEAVGFAIGSKGYIGTGSDGSNVKNDFWEYDPFTNVWTARAAFGGIARTAAAGFAFDNYGYISTGNNGSVSYNDLWRYDPRTNSWAAKSPIPGAVRSLATGFAINSRGYIGFGNNGATFHNDLWEYNASFDSWSMRSPFPGVARTGAVGFAIGNKGYIGTGLNGTTALSDFYEFDPYFNTWATKANFMGTARREAVGFSIANKGYIGLGLSGAVYNKNMYEYSPTNTNIITGQVPGTAFCVGSSFVLPFSIGCVSMGADNLFIASLSDSLGNFSTTYSIGSTTSAAGTINCTIPSYVPKGSKYRVRVYATNPATVGTENGVDIAIKPAVTGTVTAGISNSSICRGETINLTAAVSNPATSDTSVVLSENFNTGAASWLMTNTNSYQFGNTQIYTNGQGGFYSNDNSSFYLTSSSGRFSTDITNTTLQSPKFNTLGMNSASLSFWQCYQFGNYNNSDSIRVQISINNGQSWTTIYLNNSHSVGDPQDSLGFVNQTISLDNFMNQPSVVLRFNYGAYGGMGRWMIDNILVKGISKSNNFTWTSNPAGFNSILQNPTNVVPTVVPGTTIYTVVFSNSYGCGTISNSVSVNVKDTSSSTTTISICPSELPYVWNGLTFNSAGTQVKHLVNSVGCDSAAKLILVVRPASASTTTINICPSELPYTWNGLMFSAAGAQTAHFTNSVGCDSAATLNLTIKPVSTYATNLSICETALPYIWNGLTFNAAGSQTAHFTNSVGCDSAVTLNLTTIPSSATATANLTYVCPGAAINLQASSPSGGAVTILNEKFNSTHNNWTKTNLSSGGIVENAAWTLRPNNYELIFGLSLNSNDNSPFYLSSSFSQGTAVTTNTILQSPVFSTVGLSTASLSFYHHFSHQNNFPNDSVRVQVSADGTNWTNIYFNKTTSVGSPTSFQLQTISLNGYLNIPTLRLRFNYNGTPIVGGYSNYYWAIDNVLVNGTLLPNNYSWTSVPAGFTSALQNPATFNPTQTATYNVAVNNGFCSRAASVAIVVNTVNPTSTTNLAICAASLPYSWNGLTFNAAGTQTAHILTTGGCDSSATLILTLKAASSSITNITICPSGLPFTWNGLVFNAAGSQVKHLVNSVGCDSAATLNLAVLTSSTSSNTTITICQNQLPYTWNGLIFTGAGKQTKLLTNIFGCDSAATLNLLVSIRPANVTAAASLTTVCAGTAFNLSSSSVANTSILDENFNAAANSWTTQNLSGGGTAAAAAFTLRPAGYLFLGAIAIQSNDNSQFYMTDSYSQGSGGTTNTILQSPVFSTVGYSAASLSFYQVFSNRDANDSVRVQVSSNAGSSWTTVYVKKQFIGGYTSFALTTVSLDAYINMPALMLRFNYGAANDFLWALDNVKITGTPLPAAYSWSSVPAGFTSSLQNPAGVIATQSTTYKVIATNSNGCSDSNTVAVTVKPVSTSTNSLSICPGSLPYTWNGLSFTGAGSQTAHLINSVGCDSAATLVLTVKATSSSVSSVSICPSSLPYSWNGLVFNTAGTQTAHFLNSIGCDSAATLTLTLKNTSVSSSSITICESALPYTWNGLTFNAAGTQTAHFLNSVGCDSAASLNLVVNASPMNVTATASITSVCEGGSINLFASSTTPAGGANVVLLNEDFNGAINNWTKINQSTGGTPAAAAWTLRPDGYTPAGAPTMHSNDNSQFYLSNSDAQGNGGHTNTTLQSPAFSTVGYSTASLSFYHLYFNADAFYDRIKVQVSTDGTNWSDIYVNSSHVFSGANYDFALETISLNSYLNKPNVRLRFNYDCFWGFRWGIDNVKVTGTPLNTYSWTSSPAGFTSALQNPSGIIPTSTTEYMVTVGTSNGCTVSNTVLVAVSPGPSATIAYEGSPCSADATTLVTQTGTTGGVYTAPAGLIIDPVTGTVTRAGSTPGIYTVTYTIAASGSCPQFITTAPVTVATTYTIVAAAGANGTISSPGTSIVCEGTNITYSINPAACASITDVLVNGSSVGPVSSYTFTNVAANNSINAIFSPVIPQPAVACYQSAVFNSATCQWDVTGTAPVQPTMACYQSAVLDSASCEWIVTGTQPTQPAPVNCWDNYQFNTTSCLWVNMGIQPTQPAPVNCWDNYQFNTTSCSWVNVGIQPTQPAPVNCWDNYQFNTNSCTWVNMGTQPIQPTPFNCWDNYQFNTTSCTWVNIGSQPTEPPRVNCWDDFQFNTTTCTWVNNGTQQTQPASVHCWDNYQFSTGSCAWVNIGVEPPAPPRVNCWDDYQFNNVSCTWVNTGTQPTPPPSVNCWDNYQFNQGSCTWVNIGVQPPAPPTSNCWDNYQFNTATCSWVNTGTHPAPPTSVNCWDNYQFNTTSCSWVNMGIQPAPPTSVNCWDNYEFSTVTCTWVNTGTQPIQPVPVNCWDNYQFNTTSCTWVNMGIQVAAPTITQAGPANICPGSTITLTSGNALNNQWYLNGNILTGQTGTTLVVNAPGSYTVATITNGCSSSISNAVDVTLSAYTITVTPVANGSISPGTGSVNCGDSATYIITANAGFSIADVIVDGLSQGAMGAYTFTNVTTNHTISASFITDNVSFTITSSAGAGGTISPNGATPVATGGDQTYSVTANACFTITDVLVDGVSVGPVSSYSFNSVTADHTITASFTENGPYTITASAGPNGSVAAAGSSAVACGSDNTYSITAASCYHIADVKVDGVSAGAVSTYTFSNTQSNHTLIATFAANATLTMPVVTGPTNVCPYIGTGEQVTYTASSAGATSYNWIIPPNVLVVSGQGTETLTVTFNTGFAAQANKQLKVTGLSSCGNSVQTIYYLLAQAPGTAAPITGNTNVCPIIGTAATYSYSIPPVTGATAYVWTAQAGTTVISNNGTSADISFDNNFTTSAITVRAVNGCGTSNARSIVVVRSNPSTPGLISGSTNACPYMAPNGTAATYSILPVTGAVSYNWTVPGGTAITGQGTTSIAFTYPAGFTSGIITVTATNGCGTSEARSLAIGKTTPGTAGVIDVIQVQTCPARIYSYTLATMPYGAASVLWTVPAGATILTGTGTSSITVSYPPTAVAGAVTAQGISNCGNGTTRSTPVKLAACTAPTPFAKENIGKAVSAEAMTVSVYPNPSVSDFNLKVITAGKEIVHVRILDAQGRVYKQFTVLPYQTTTIGADLKAGAYLLEVRQGGVVKMTKIVKF